MATTTSPLLQPIAGLGSLEEDVSVQFTGPPLVGLGLAASHSVEGLDNLDSRHPPIRSETNHSIQASNHVSLVFKDLTVKAQGRVKPLLNNISGKILGGFYAIMGPSGSGKTTLLNTLAHRLDRGTSVANGEMRLNGRPYSSAHLKLCSGYVMQDDLLNVNLTVEETLYYTAELRLPAATTAAERQERIELVVSQVSLTHVRDVLVGHPLKKGISGGERKRLCVGMELMTRPMLLFLDEPTSGLDSVTALVLCAKLRELTDSGQLTAICTIHQPQAKIFNLFDQLLLLKSGTIVYQGVAQHALRFFEGTGYACPEFENPADFFLDVITPSAEESIEVAAIKERKIADAYRSPSINLDHGIDRPELLQRDATSWGHQFNVLLRRSLQEQWRKRDVVIVQLIQSVVMAVLIGSAFLHIGDTFSSVAKRTPVIFFCVINQGMFAALMVINSFPAERMLVLRERMAGTYHVSAYFAAKNVAETLVQIPVPIIFSCTVYFLIGLVPSAGKFFVFTAFMILTSLAATSLALMVSALARTTDLSVTVLPMALEICRLFGGFFIPPATLPNYFVWLDALSYVKYAYVAIAYDQLTDLHLTCNVKIAAQTTLLANGTRVCSTPNGEVTIEHLGLAQLTVAQGAGILISYIFIARFIAFLGVRYIKF